MSDMSNLRFDTPRKYIRGGGARGALLDTGIQIAEGIITNQIAKHLNAIQTKTSKSTATNKAGNQDIKNSNSNNRFSKRTYRVSGTRYRRRRTNNYRRYTANKRRSFYGRRRYRRFYS